MAIHSSRSARAGSSGLGRPLPGAGDPLVICAMAMIDRDGVEGFSIKNLCEELGVSPSLVNYHFAGRGGLISSVITRALDDLRIRQAHPEPEATPAERLTYALGASVEWAALHPGLLAAMVLRVSDNFATEVPQQITDDLHGAWGAIQLQCGDIANSFCPDEPHEARGLHLLWVLLGSMAWLTFPTLGEHSHELARAHLPMSPSALLSMLHTTFRTHIDNIETFEPLHHDIESPRIRKTRDNLIEVTAALLESTNGRSISARTVCEIAQCAPSLVTYHFGTFESLVAHAATRIFVTAALQASEVSMAHLPPRRRLTEWLWIVARSASGSLSLPVALGSTSHRERLLRFGENDLEEQLRVAWMNVIGSTATLAEVLLQSETHAWPGMLQDFSASGPLLETMSLIGLTGLGASLWMCSVGTYSSRDEIEMALAGSIPVIVDGISRAAIERKKSDS